MTFSPELPVRYAHQFPVLAGKAMQARDSQYGDAYSGPLHLTPGVPVPYVNRLKAFVGKDGRRRGMTRSLKSRDSFVTVSREVAAVVSSDSRIHIGPEWHPFLETLRTKLPLVSPSDHIRSAIVAMFMPVKVRKTKRGPVARVVFKGQRYKLASTLRFKSFDFSVEELLKAPKHDGSAYYKKNQTLKGVLRLRKK